MTKSLEALEILRECANGEKKVLFSTSLELANTIKQDLEELESLHHAYNELEATNKELYKENQELKEWNKKYLSELERWGYPETPIHISKYKKFKKAIEILKDTIILPMENDIARVDMNGNNHYLLSFVKRLISEQEYELLKEVLE